MKNDDFSGAIICGFICGAVVAAAILRAIGCL